MPFGASRSGAVHTHLDVVTNRHRTNPGFFEPVRQQDWACVFSGADRAGTTTNKRSSVGNQEETDDLIREAEKAKAWVQDLMENSPGKASMLRQMLRLRVMMDTDYTSDEITEILSDPSHPARDELLAYFLQYLIQERRARESS